MPLIDGQIQIHRPGSNTILLNQNTPYDVTDFNPWDRGVRANQSGDIAWGDGEWSGAEWRTGTSIPLQVEMAEGSWSALMQAYWPLDAALAPVRTGPESEVTWSAGGTEYLMYGRPRGATMHRRSLEHGTARVTSSLFCPDPAIYSAEEYVVTIGMLSRVGGFSTPFSVPLSSYDVIADGQANLSNAGTTPARLLLRIDGPAIRPYVTVTDASGTQSLHFDTVLAAGDWLQIDTKAKLVVLNGSTSRLRDAHGSWPLLTGDAVIQFQAEEYHPDARLTVRWRDTY